MKILITTDWYAPVINGVVTSVLNLVQGLSDLGHDVRVLTLSGSTHSYKSENVYYIGSLDAGNIYPNARVFIPMADKYIREIEEWNPDIIHSQCEFSTFMLAERIAGKCKTPIVHTYHTVYEGYTHYFCPNKKLGRKLVRTFTRRIATQTERFIVPSSKMLDMLENYHISAPIDVIPSGIRLEKYMQEDPEDRREIRSRYGIADDEVLLVYIGRVAKEKNLEEIVSFLAREDLPKLRLLVVGDGPARGHVEKEVARLDLTDRVIFTGMVSPAEVQRYYKAGDIFVSASTSETQGLTYMEAMASGLPLVCRKDACLRDVIDEGHNGFTYESGEEFARHVRFLASDEGKRREIGDAAAESMKAEFSVPAFAGKCLEVYKEVLEAEEIRRYIA